MVVARRLPPEKLAVLTRDPDWCVRFVVASRIDPDALEPLTRDPVDEVRTIAQQRRAGVAADSDLIPD